MKIFIINLKHDNEKREKMKDKLNKLNIKYEFFDAIDGKNAEHNGVYTGWVDSYHNRYVTKGEIGCSLSHYYIWEKIINENIETAIVLEDDVEVLDINFIEKVENQNNKYDLLYLSRKKITGEIETSINDDIATASPSYWTCAYAVSLSGVKKLKNDIFFDNIIPVDEYIPYLYSNTYNKHLDCVYGELPKITACAFKNNLLKPEGYAFQVSSTYFSHPCDKVRDDVILVTVATDMNDPLKRYISSCKQFGFNPVILGLGTKWNGGDMEKGPGGGQKVILLQEYINSLNITDNKLIVFTDSYDVICNNNINKLVETYKSTFENKIVFASESSCWPDKKLAELYPNVTQENKYLNSGVFIGYLNDIKKIIKKEIKPHEDDQLYYTLCFLSNQDKMVLDYENKLFVCLNCDENSYNINKSESLLHCTNNNIPCFLHGNGPPKIKRRLNNIGNYTCNYYNSIYGYKNINKVSGYQPDITIIFEEINNPCQDVIDGICNIDYPREKIKLIYLYNKKPINDIINNYKKCLDLDNLHLLDNFIDLKNTNNIILLKERLDNNSILNIFQEIHSEKVFYINSECNLKNKNILNLLLSENKQFIGPVLKNKDSLYSNVWGDLDDNNYYKRSQNYIDIIENREQSCWNVPYIGYCYLIDAALFKIKHLIENSDKGSGYDMALCYNMRKNNIFMYALNTEFFGNQTGESGQKDVDITDIKLTDYKEYTNLWEKKYLHNSFDKHAIMNEIGNNICKIQIFNEIFCNEIIDTANKKASWSKGGEHHYDKRLGGKENYPTQDIHLNEIGLEEMWKWVVETYISKLVWNKYNFSYKDINISFVVKYDMDGQRELNSHHDSSTFTVNLCLNNDFEGSGCHFIKDNLTCVNKDIGSIILHPGKLTHYHKAMPLTVGKRYILVSFIN
jgi:GR25 family glycosyltransferase involved in LPS biosynthesis